MRSMKKIAAAILSVTMLVSLTACSGSGSADTTTAAATEAATTAAKADGGDTEPAKEAESKVEIDRTKEFVPLPQVRRAVSITPSAERSRRPLETRAIRLPHRQRAHLLKILI